MHARHRQPSSAARRSGTVTGPALRGRPLVEIADRYGTTLRSGRPVRRRRHGATDA